MTATTINLRFALAMIEGGKSALNISLAMTAVRDALRAANRAGDNAAKSTCLRILNWLRCEMRRL